MVIRQATFVLSLVLLAEGVLVAVPLAPVPLLLEVPLGDLVVRVLGVRRVLVVEAFPSLAGPDSASPLATSLVLYHRVGRLIPSIQFTYLI